jgi:hypothetical protein
MDEDMLTDLLDVPSAPPLTTFADRMRQASEEMTKLFAERTAGKDVWLVVLIDATSSMDVVMRQACGGVMSMFRALRHDLGCTLQVGIVAYRDPVDCETDTHDTFAFHGAAQARRLRGTGQEARARVSTRGGNARARGECAREGGMRPRGCSSTPSSRDRPRSARE